MLKFFLSPDMDLTTRSEVVVQKLRAEQPTSGMPGCVSRSISLTILLLLAIRITETRPEMPATPPNLMPGAVVVLSTPPSSTPAPQATVVPTQAPSSTPIPTSSKAVVLPLSRTPTRLDEVATQANRKTATTTPTRTATRTLTKTPTFTPGFTPASTANSTATVRPSLVATPTVDPGQPGSEYQSYVPAGYEDTSLGRAVSEYNATHPKKITMYVVSGGSAGMEGAMYQDLIERRLRIMGPEDFAGSIQLPAWPDIVIAIEEELNANSVTGWRYVLDHERVHMVAAANLAADDVNLAQLMRQPDGTFTHEALFHEVCADFFPTDENGNHRPVANFYDAMNRMPELLRVLSEVDVAVDTYRPPPHYEVLPITGLSLIDAACVWDRQAMQMVRELYDEQVGPGAFDALLPTY